MLDAAPSVVVFDRDGNLASLQRAVLRTMGSTRSGLVATENALLKELVIGRQLILLNWTDDWDGLTDLVRTIRNKETSPDPFVGIVVLSPSLSSSKSRAALDVGVNSLVRVPFSAGQIMAHVSYVTSKSWRFIDAPNYFGPDRRVHQELHEQGERRGSGECIVLEGDALAEERTRMRSTTLAAFEMKVAHTA